MIPGEMLAAATATSSSTPAARRSRVERRQHRRPADPGRLALPLLRDQRGAAFDRAAARGFRLNIAAGTAVRFEPGQTRTVELVALAGDAHRLRLQRRGDGAARREVAGSTRSGAPRGEGDGDAGARDEDHAPRLCRDVRPDRRRPRAARRHRALVEVERDLTIYGEEVKFGGGKVIRDGMGQSQRSRKRLRRHRDHQRAGRSTGGASSSATSGSRTAASRSSARPATRTSSRASTSSSARAPRSSPAKA